MQYNNFLYIIQNLYYGNNIEKYRFNDSAIEMLSYHRLIGYMYSYLNSEKLNAETEKNFLNNLNYRINKYNIYKKEIKNIISLFNENNIDYIFIKAFSLFNYYKPYTRSFNDVDILINHSDINHVIKIIKKLGFEFAYIDRMSKKYIKASRKEILFCLLNKHETFELIKKVDNIFVSIDINFLFQWRGLKNPQIPFKELYSNSKNQQNYCHLNIVYNILHLSCHFYNETVHFVFDYENIYEDPAELKLFRIFDILLLLEKIDENQQNQIIEISLNYHIEDEIKFTLKVIEEFFPKKLPKLLYEFSISKPNLYNNINIYLNKNGEYSIWPISIFDRAFNIQLKNKAIRKMIL